ncbi:hypothetical protein XI06_14240 [Bradyrhizobium sp. CCBAU 11434]|uniref:hypothetical protein n=1 Tax=Bradyrhizobium sp. CCBAU 11434 TaxID=1630885 RepID=UPI0023050189|nr:hypothetical protein [Bradyrhizobium sp. CCBAU 11434]MDA9521479.1 hypothetical protein [Bradyrhizobium sp. CCBAU 11434]
MSTITRRKRTSRINIGPYKRHELLFGEIRYPVYGYSGYGDGFGTDLTVFISDDMREDWNANRDELVSFWKSGEFTDFETFSDSLPWLFDRGYTDGLPWASLNLDGRRPPQEWPVGNAPLSPFATHACRTAG